MVGLGNEGDEVGFLGWIVFIEHLFLVLRLVIELVIDDTPDLVKKQKLEKDGLLHRYRDEIEQREDIQLK